MAAGLRLSRFPSSLGEVHEAFLDPGRPGCRHRCRRHPRHGWRCRCRRKGFCPCKACHAVVADKNLVGPSLFGVSGRKAGTLASAASKYSPQLVASGLTWDDATLDKWLTSPKDLVTGTKMTFPGLPDATKRQDIIAYLKTLK